MVTIFLQELWSLSWKRGGVASALGGLVLGLSLSCASGGGGHSADPVKPPVITSFVASQSNIPAGKAVQLMAVFSNGTGVISPGNLATTSGQPVQVIPSGTTSYSLTVTNTEAIAVTQSTLVQVQSSPVVPEITTKADVSPGAAGILAFVSPQEGCAYCWTITGGMITAGLGTSQVTYTAGNSGSVVLNCVITNAVGEVSAPGRATATIDPPPSITSFTPGKPVITTGDATTLQAVFEGGSGSISPDIGRITSGATVGTGALKADTAYTLTVTNAAGACVTVQAIVGVVPAPCKPVLAVPYAVTEGRSGLIASTPVQPGCSYAWTITGGTLTSSSVGPEITFTAGAAGTVIHLSCSVINAAGMVSAAGTAFSSVWADVAISSFTASRTSIYPGQSATLAWSFSGTDSAYLSPCDVHVPNAGTQIVSPLVTTVYSLSTGNPAGAQAQSQITITVLPTPPAPLLAAFTAIRPSTHPGGSVLLKADFAGGTAVVDQGVGTLTSGVPVASGPLSASTTFTVTVTNAVGAMVSAQVRVLVGALEVLAGWPSGVGNLDGIGGEARFSAPGWVAMDSAGNAYVTSPDLIRKITPGGAVTTLAGTLKSDAYREYSDGAGAAASFQYPAGVVADAAGNLYVADSSSHTIRMVTAKGSVSTLAGSAGELGSDDGPARTARFDNPQGLALDALGNLFVADAGNFTIRKITPDGMVSTLAGVAGQSGSSDGLGSEARFGLPMGMAIDQTGNLYVADFLGGTVRKVTPTGLVSTLAGPTNSNNGPLGPTKFGNPYGVAADAAGNIYVTDAGWTMVWKITPAGLVSHFAGSGYVGHLDGDGTTATFNHPQGIAVDPAGNLLVADLLNNTVRAITPAGVVSTWAGNPGDPGNVDGAARSARFDSPGGVAVALSGNIYVADTYNQSIRMITPVGEVTTVAGNPNRHQGCADGTGAAASFSGLRALAVDRLENVYAVDTNSMTIRKMSPGGVVTTLAGSAGESAFRDGIGAQARFRYPIGCAVDDGGNVYVTDVSAIRMISPAGQVSTLAGNIEGRTGTTDGPGASAAFNIPCGVAVGPDGNVYVADTLNNTIRKITPGGLVSTLAGTAGIRGSADGTGPAASFDFPYGLSVDNDGTLYVVDRGNQAVRRVSPGGVVDTVLGRPGMAAVTPGPLPGMLSEPMAVAVHPGTGNLLIALPDAILKAVF